MKYITFLCLGLSLIMSGRSVYYSQFAIFKVGDCIYRYNKDFPSYKIISEEQGYYNVELLPRTTKKPLISDFSFFRQQFYKVTECKNL